MPKELPKKVKNRWKKSNIEQYVLNEIMKNKIVKYI